jgi:short-subunit dehydrogenase
LGSTEQTPRSRFDAGVNALDVRARPSYYLVVVLAPAMAERGSRAVINVSTMAAALGVSEMALYG